MIRSPRGRRRTKTTCNEYHARKRVEEAKRPKKRLKKKKQQE